jgi:hypothetical protein
MVTLGRFCVNKKFPELSVDRGQTTGVCGYFGRNGDTGGLPRFPVLVPYLLPNPVFSNIRVRGLSFDRVAAFDFTAHPRNLR